MVGLLVVGFVVGLFQGGFVGLLMDSCVGLLLGGQVGLFVGGMVVGIVVVVGVFVIGLFVGCLVVGLFVGGMVVGSFVGSLGLEHPAVLLTLFNTVSDHTPPASSNATQKKAPPLQVNIPPLYAFRSERT